MGSSLRNLGLGNKWKGTGSLTELLLNGLITHDVGVESIGSFRKRLDKFMDKDDWWN